MKNTPFNRNGSFLPARFFFLIVRKHPVAITALFGYRLCNQCRFVLGGHLDVRMVVVTIYVLWWQSTFFTLFTALFWYRLCNQCLITCLVAPLDVCMLAVTFFTLFYCFVRISAVQPMNSHAWWPSRCSHASGDNPHTLCTNLTLDCTNITLDRIDAMSTTTVLVRRKRRHMGRSYLIARRSD